MQRPSFYPSKLLRLSTVRTTGGTHSGGRVDRFWGDVRRVDRFKRVDRFRLCVRGTFLTLCAVAGLYMPVPQASAQNASLRGIVTDALDGQPLQSVHVSLRHDDATLGTVTDADGVYVFGGVPPGRYELRASYIGFATFVDSLDLEPDDALQIDITLEEASGAVGEIVVQAERETGAVLTAAGQQRVSAQDIELIPSPLVSGDLVNYLSAQPGVVSIGDRGGQLFIRGGEPTQNLTLLDGMQIYQPFHLLGFYSAFPSDIVSSAEIYAGGFGAAYSGRTSSVIDVQTRNGSKRAYRGSASFTPFVSSLSAEGPLLGGISFLASGRLSTLEEVASSYIDDDLPYRFGDVFGKLHIPIAQHHQTSVSALNTFDRGTLAEPTLFGANNEIRWQNTAVGIRHLVLPRQLSVRGEALFSYSHLDTEFGPSEEPTRAAAVDNYSLDVNISNFGRVLQVDWGFFFRSVSLSANLGGDFQELVERAVRSTNAGIYTEANVTLAGRLNLRAGAVAQHFDNSGFNVEPRLRAVLDYGDHRLSAAFGLYRQNIIGLNDRRDAANVFTAYAEAPAGAVPAAIHVLAGYRGQPTSWLTMSIDGFYKRLDNQHIGEWTAFPRFTTRLQPATGRVVGADLRFEIRTSRLYGAVNYGLSSVRYEARQASLPVWFGTDRLSFRPPHDRRHQINLLLTATVRRFDLSARWNFGSGLPYTRVQGFDGFVLMDSFVDLQTTEGFPRVIYDRPYRGVLPTYHRLDVTVERSFELSGAELTLQAGAINVYDRTNLFALDVFTLRRTNQLPFVPTAGLELSF